MSQTQEEVSSISEGSHKMTSRQLQALRTKNRIYQSGLRVIERTGFRNASIEEITKDAGVSTGSFYNYFASKEQLLLFSFIKSDERYLEAYEEAKALNFPDSLYSFINNSYFYLEQRGREFMNGINMCLLTPDFKSASTNRDREFFKCIRKLFEAGMEQGVLSSDTDIDACIHMIFAMLTGVEMIWCMEDSLENLATVAEESVRSVMEGLLH